MSVIFHAIFHSKYQTIKLSDYPGTCLTRLDSYYHILHSLSWKLSQNIRISGYSITFMKFANNKKKQLNQTKPTQILLGSVGVIQSNWDNQVDDEPPPIFPPSPHKLCSPVYVVVTFLGSWGISPLAKVIWRFVILKPRQQDYCYGFTNFCWDKMVQNVIISQCHLNLFKSPHDHMLSYCDLTDPFRSSMSI